MVRGDGVKNRGADRWRPTRREVLGAAAAGACGLLAATDGGFGQTSQPASARTQVNPPASPPWWLRCSEPRARVVDVRSSSVLHASTVDRVVLGEALEQGIQGLTGATTEEAAWRTVLGSAERIVLKFNAVGASVINTNDALARILVERIGAAGYGPEKIALVEVFGHLAKQFGTRDVVPGWGPPIRVGGNIEPLAQYLYDADAIINVPVLKTHQIAGMSGCLKNLSHALVRHPARYHANGCAPYVAQVVGAQEVSAKIKLNVLSALRVVIEHGPDAREENIAGYGALLLGFDPVAVDTVGLSILATERRRRGLTSAIEVRYLASAAEMGIGRWRPAEIDRVMLEMGG